MLLQLHHRAARVHQLHGSGQGLQSGVVEEESVEAEDVAVPFDLGVEVVAGDADVVEGQGWRSAVLGAWGAACLQLGGGTWDQSAFGVVWSIWGDGETGVNGEEKEHDGEDSGDEIVKRFHGEGRILLDQRGRTKLPRAWKGGGNGLYK